MAGNRLLLPRLILGLAVFCVVLDSCAAGEWFYRQLFGDLCDPLFPHPCEGTTCLEDTHSSHRHRRSQTPGLTVFDRRRCHGIMVRDRCRPCRRCINKPR